MLPKTATNARSFLATCRRMSFWIATIAAIAMCFPALAAKPPKGGGKAPKSDAKTDTSKDANEATAKSNTATSPGPPLPNDLNIASLRVHAIDTLYELDFSTDQLKELRAAAAGTASDQHRTAAKGTPKLAAALQQFQGAVLDGQDQERIDSLRNEIADLVDDETVHLDDEVQITAAARGKAPGVLRLLTASQIAAYLASHADEVGDPTEVLTAALADLRELHATEAGDGEKSEAAAEAASLINDTATEVGYLIAGLDEAKAKELADKVAKWLKTNAELKDDEYAAKRKSLEEAAKAFSANIHPMKVLGNWLEHQVAILISNPQLAQAIEAMVAARQKD
jgi:hypothetical protein